MDICSSFFSSPRWRRYSSAEMSIVLAYTWRTASSKALSRVSSVPKFTQNTDSYLPAKALPKPSSRKLEERTIIGLWP